MIKRLILIIKLFRESCGSTPYMYIYIHKYLILSICCREDINLFRMEYGYSFFYENGVCGTYFDGAENNREKLPSHTLMGRNIGEGIEINLFLSTKRNGDRRIYSSFPSSTSSLPYFPSYRTSNLNKSKHNFLFIYQAKENKNNKRIIINLRESNIYIYIYRHIFVSCMSHVFYTTFWAHILIDGLIS